MAWAWVVSVYLYYTCAVYTMQLAGIRSSQKRSRTRVSPLLLPRYLILAEPTVRREGWHETDSPVLTSL